ncbi:hypothetical protein P3L10_008715 [Capsicum annuum]
MSLDYKLQDFLCCGILSRLSSFSNGSSLFIHIAITIPWCRVLSPSQFKAGAIILVLGMHVYTWRPKVRKLIVTVNFRPVPFEGEEDNDTILQHPQEPNEGSRRAW